jgi:hypothetical protein
LSHTSVKNFAHLNAHFFTQAIDGISADIPGASISAVIVAKRHLFTSFFLSLYNMISQRNLCFLGTFFCCFFEIIFDKIALKKRANYSRKGELE